MADIFDIDDNEKVDAENPTLKFDPPKQIPKHKTTDKATLWDVIIAKIVGAYKLYVCIFLGLKKKNKIKLIVSFKLQD